MEELLNDYPILEQFMDGFTDLLDNDVITEQEAVDIFKKGINEYLRNKYPKP